jgi:uncharacterized membrane-anchored protein
MSLFDQFPLWLNLLVITLLVLIVGGLLFLLVRQFLMTRGTLSRRSATLRAGAIVLGVILIALLITVLR